MSPTPDRLRLGGALRTTSKSMYTASGIAQPRYRTRPSSRSPARWPNAALTVVAVGTWNSGRRRVQARNLATSRACPPPRPTTAAARGRRASSATSSLSSSVSTRWTPARNGPASWDSNRGHRSAIVTTRYGRWTNSGSSATSSWPKTVRKPVAASASAAVEVTTSRLRLRRDQRQVVEAQPDRVRAIAHRQPPAAADICSEQPPADIDANLGGGPLEDHPVDLALDDVGPATVLTVVEQPDVLGAEVGDHRVADL